MAEQLLSSQDQRVLCTVTHCPATVSSIKKVKGKQLDH
jgi:hypothetical protein